MASKLRAHLSYANVVSTVCLFVVLGGSSYAALTVSGKQIVNNSVRSKDIRNNDVRGKDIRNATVASRDVQNAALLAEDFKPGQLPAGEKARRETRASRASGDRARRSLSRAPSPAV